MKASLAADCTGCRVDRLDAAGGWCSGACAAASSGAASGSTACSDIATGRTLGVVGAATLGVAAVSSGGTGSRCAVAVALTATKGTPRPNLDRLFLTGLELPAVDAELPELTAAEPPEAADAELVGVENDARDDEPRRGKCSSRPRREAVLLRLADACKGELAAAFGTVAEEGSAAASEAAEPALARSNAPAAFAAARAASKSAVCASAAARAACAAATSAVAAASTVSGASATASAPTAAGAGASMAARSRSSCAQTLLTNSRPLSVATY